MVGTGELRAYQRKPSENRQKQKRCRAKTQCPHTKPFSYTCLSQQGIVNIFVSTGVAIVFVAILSSRKVRKKVFNNYLLYLTFPDFVYSFLCVFTCLISSSKGYYSSPDMCNFQALYLVFGLSANGWLNGMTAWEVYRLLRSSHIRKKYYPPKRKEIAYKAFAVYAYCLFLGFLILISGEMLSARPMSGFFCIAGSHDHASDLFFWLFFVPLSFGIPYLIVFWVFYDVMFRSKLLPARGKRRDLSVYFFRISFVFLFMWMPAIVIHFMCRGRTSPWVVWAVATWSHLQGLVSAGIACLKPDIYQSVIDLLRCKKCYSNMDQQGGGSSSIGLANSSFLKSFAKSSVSDVVAKRNHSDDGSSEAEDIPAQDRNFQFLDEKQETQLESSCLSHGDDALSSVKLGCTETAGATTISSPMECADPVPTNTAQRDEENDI